MQALQMKGYLLRQLVKWESERNDDTLKKTALSRAYIVEERQPEKHQIFGINFHTCCPIEIEKVKVDNNKLEKNKTLSYRANIHSCCLIARPDQGINQRFSFALPYDGSSKIFERLQNDPNNLQFSFRFLFFK